MSDKKTIDLSGFKTAIRKSVENATEVSIDQFAKTVVTVYDDTIVELERTIDKNSSYLEEVKDVKKHFALSISPDMLSMGQRHEAASEYAESLANFDSTIHVIGDKTIGGLKAEISAATSALEQTKSARTYFIEEVCQGTDPSKEVDPS